MSKVAIFMADGCEEIEALTVVDILRRGGLEIDMVSINGADGVTGSHGIAFSCDKRIEDTDLPTYDALVLPGGMTHAAEQFKYLVLSHYRIMFISSSR